MRKGGGGEEEREKGIGRERKFRLFERGGVTKKKNLLGSGIY